MTLVTTGRIMALLLAAALVTACGGGATSGGIGGGGGGGGGQSANAFLADLTLSCDEAVGGEAQCNTMQLRIPEELEAELGIPPDGFLPGAAQDDLTDYNSQQGALVNAITVTPTAANVNATIAVNGISVPTGQASVPLPLDVGETVITIVVTAVDGVTQLTYRLFVTRLPDNLTELTALSLSSGTLDPAFARDVTGYSAAVANTISTVQVTATTLEPAATITVNGAPATSGAPSGNVALAVGENEVVVEVTAVDGTTTQSYVITVTRIGSANLSAPLLLFGVPDDGGDPVQLSLNATFDPANRTAYTVSVESRIVAVVVIPTVTAAQITQGATITVEGEPVAAGDPSEPFVLGEDPDENRIRIVVTHPFSGEEEPLTRTYTLTIIRQDPPLFEPEAWLKPSVEGERLVYGSAIALSADGETMAVGARGVLFDINVDEDEQERFAGSVYVYARDAFGDWDEQALIVPFNSEEEDRFGFSVALSADGKRLAIGAPRESAGVSGQDGPFTDISAIPAADPVVESGAVYTYVRDNGGVWEFESYIKSPFPGEGYRFGHSVALSGDGLVLAIGETGEASDLFGVTDTAAFQPEAVEETDSGGAVHVYVDGQDGVAPWTPNAVIKAPARIEGLTVHTGTLFGSAVTLTPDGGLLAIGMAGEDSNATSIDSVETGTGIRTESGAVYLHAREAGSWNDDPTYIKTRVEVPRNGHHFGHSLALSAAGDALAVGAPGHFNDSRGIFTGFLGEGGGSTTRDSGAAYLFRLVADAWQQEVFIKAPNSRSNFRFGESLVMSADGARVVIGAPGEASSATTVDGNMLLDNAGGSGAAYTYVRDDEADSGWARTAYLKVPNSRAGIRFGSAIAMSVDGELIAGGAPGERSAAQGVLMDTDNLPTDNPFDRRGAAYTFLAVPPPEEPDPDPEPDPEPPGDDD